MKIKDTDKLKKELSHYKKKAEAYRDYAYSLEKDISSLLNELKDIAVGFTFNNQPSTWSIQVKLQDRAATKLKEFANKDNTMKPKGMFYL